MKKYIFDIESDGLLDTVTKIHCLSYIDCDTDIVKTIYKKQDLISFFKEDAVFIGHNIIRYDIPLVEMMLDIDLSKIKKIDTLGLSWYLFCDRNKHGLESWSKFTGVRKPKVEDWKHNDLSVYQERCEYDVKNNFVLYKHFEDYLNLLYPSGINSIINYINFKLECLREQEKYKIPLDIEKAKKTKAELEAMLDEKKQILSEAMPNYLGKVIKTKPKNLFKQDGSFSMYGRAWVVETSKRGLNYDEVDVIREKPNPGSHPQLKQWLVELGWKPETFKFSKTVSKSKKAFDKALAKYKKEEKLGLVQNIETSGRTITKESAQISLPFGAGICDSVKELYEVEPRLEALEDYYKIVHRLGILDGNNGYLQKVKDGMIASTAHGFTNTMRLTHSSPIVNLPKPGTFYGEEVRGCLTVKDKENYIMCGSDISSLEDSTKQHYIYFYDSDYVKEMRVPGFCPHIDISVLSGLMTKKEGDFYKKVDNMSDKEKEALSVEDLAKFSKLKKKRHTGKTVNFCLPVDNTEVLTSEGWKQYQNLSKSDQVFSYVDGELVASTIEEIHYYDDTEVMSISNKWFNFEATKNHRWLVNKRVRSRNNPRSIEKYVETHEINHDCNIIRSAPYKTTCETIGIKNSKILGWLLADGHLEYPNGIKMSISQKKHIPDLEYNLQSLIYRKDESRKDGVVIFEIKAKSARQFLKDCSLPLEKSKHDIDYTSLIISMSFKEREAFLHSFWLADGGWHGKSKAIYQNRGKILDAVLLALTLNGFNYTINSNGKYKNHENVNVYISNRKHTTGQRIIKKHTRKTSVFCLTTQNGNFIAKQGNHVTITGNSATYGAGGPKIAKTAGITVQEGYELHRIYWERNKAVKQAANDAIVKEVNGQKWLLNPISGFWMFLKEEKDKFSTLNQSSGVFVFDMWLREVKKLLKPKSIPVLMQYHDEIMLICKKTDKDFVEKSLNKAMVTTNKLLNLNVEITVSVEFGDNYADVH